MSLRVPRWPANDFNVYFSVLFVASSQQLPRTTPATGKKHIYKSYRVRLQPNKLEGGLADYDSDDGDNTNDNDSEPGQQHTKKNFAEAEKKTF